MVNNGVGLSNSGKESDNSLYVKTIHKNSHKSMLAVGILDQIYLMKVRIRSMVL